MLEEIVNPRKKLYPSGESCAHAQVRNVRQPAYEKVWLFILLTMAVTVFLFASPIKAWAAGGLERSTSYPGITAKPGENLSFSVALQNSLGASLNADLSVTSIPDGWEGYFNGGGNQVSRVHVNSGGDGATVTFNVKIPDDVSEGTYPISLQADAGEGIVSAMDLVINVNEAAVGQSSFTSQYPELQGSPSTSFSFNTTLANNGAADQSYSLSAQAPEGWQVQFKPSGETNQVASLNVEAGQSQGIAITVTPAANATAGDYKISCSAASAGETLTTDLTVTITGTYDLSLSTPSGRLSLDAYANKETPVTLSITNNGSADLQNVSLTSSAPDGWNVRFETPTVETLPAGSTQEVTAYITPGSDAITGDYVTSISAGSSETSAKADLRVSVKTHTVWGFVAVIIIIALAGGLVYVFRKYGRR